MKKESNVRAPVLLNSLSHCEKEINCSTRLAFDLFSSTRLINSIKHEHSSKILYIGTYCISEQRRLRQPYASAPPRKCLHHSNTQKSGHK